MKQIVFVSGQVGKWTDVLASRYLKQVKSGFGIRIAAYLEDELFFDMNAKMYDVILKINLKKAIRFEQK